MMNHATSAGMATSMTSICHRFPVVQLMTAALATSLLIILELPTDLASRTLSSGDLLRVLHELIVGNRRLQLGRAAARLARRVQRVRRALLPRAAAPGGGPGGRAQALSQGRAGAAGGGGCAGPHQQPALLRHRLRGELLQRRDRVEARLRLPAP